MSIQLTASIAIVKLFLKYANQKPGDERWGHGTGWLIRPDVLVTAGHCSYDYRDQLGRVTEIKAFIGYEGKDSIGRGDVQFRRGKKVATTSGWLTGKKSRKNDVSFVQLDRPFTGITPIKFIETPDHGSFTLGVVGYPGDKKQGEEIGPHMYEEFAETDFSLEESDFHMLDYKVSTFAGKKSITRASDRPINVMIGQLGSPVLIDGKNTSIGAHVYSRDPTPQVSLASTVTPTLIM